MNLDRDVLFEFDLKEVQKFQEWGLSRNGTETDAKPTEYQFLV
jgi:hypothetical protein